MNNTEPTDAQIRGIILAHWRRQFRNWGGDSLNECTMDLVDPENEDADAQENAIFERACVLLDGAEVQITWGDFDDEVEMPEETAEEDD